MFTTKSGKWPHTHRVEIDGEGNGKTIDTSYGPVHNHEIENYQVSESKLSDDPHTHEVDVDGNKKWVNGKHAKVEVEGKPTKPKIPKTAEVDVGQQSVSVPEESAKE